MEEEEKPKKESFLHKTARRSQFLNYLALIVIVIFMVISAFSGK